MANSVDPEQSDLGLHCFHMPFYQERWCMKFKEFTVIVQAKLNKEVSQIQNLAGPDKNS